MLKLILIKFDLTNNENFDWLMLQTQTQNQTLMLHVENATDGFILIKWRFVDARLQLELEDKDNKMSFLK